MIKYLAVALALFQHTWSPDARANGGGYHTGGVFKSGDILGFEPQEVEKIRLLEENLLIKVGGTSASVEVRYLMRNEAKKRVKVRFGFPVEENGGGMAIGTLSDFEAQGPHLTMTYCKNYQVSADGQNVKATWKEESPRPGDERYRNLAGWLVSEVVFKGNESKEVRISFDSIYSTKVRTVSDDSHTDPALFRYRLSTAACWAGTIGKGRIVLEPGGIDPAELRVIKPVNRFRRDGKNWVWDFTELEPALDDDLEIEAQPAIERYSGDNKVDELAYIKRGERWSIVHANYTIKASSTLPPEGERHYNPENLKTYDRAWAEGASGSGVGEWLEIVPKVPKPLAAIVFSPGFPDTSESLFKANARPKRVRVELNEEHTFSIEIPDNPAEFRIPVSGYSKPVSKVRLTFEDIWPGTQFEDLCLHSLSLHVSVDRKPEFQPAR